MPKRQNRFRDSPGGWRFAIGKAGHSHPERAISAREMASDTISQLRAGKLAGARRLNISAGLTGFPREVFDLADSLEVLDLSNNRLKRLPDDLQSLKKLRVAFFSGNDFRELPEVLGTCPALEMISFRANGLEAIHPASLPARLRWLVLTENRLERIPSSIGNCPRLQKLMLSGNRLTSLPDEMSACVNLELVRLAENRFEVLPPWLLELPRLAWLAFAGNPCSVPIAAVVEKIPWASLALEEKLGEGASGTIFRASRRLPDGTSRDVAVKVFKGSMTSDGLPESEMDACLAAGSHPHLIGALGEVPDHPDGSRGLVMPLVDRGFLNLAGPPSLDSCTRDIYGEGRTFSREVVSGIAAGIASACARLHSRGVMHGDLYAHNTLWNEAGDCRLGDFGAATFYHGAEARLLERIESRAFGCLLEELIVHAAPGAGDLAGLEILRDRCLAEKVADRPSFRDLLDLLGGE